MQLRGNEWEGDVSWWVPWMEGDDGLACKWGCVVAGGGVS